MSRAQTTAETVVTRPGEHWCHPEIAETYDSGRFDDLTGRVYKWLEERIVEKAFGRFPPRSRVLDAACGTGRIMVLLRRHGFQPVGCDISPAMMAVARRRLAALGYDAPLVESRVEHLPYPDGFFDAATCIGLLMHLDPDLRVRALRELARVTRGPLLVQYGRDDLFQRVRTRLTGRPAGGSQYPVTASEIRADLQRSRLIASGTFPVLTGVSSSVLMLLKKEGRA
jgi:SAM-dependent methyltransferase